MLYFTAKDFNNDKVIIKIRRSKIRVTLFCILAYNKVDKVAVQMSLTLPELLAIKTAITVAFQAKF